VQIEGDPERSSYPLHEVMLSSSQHWDPRGINFGWWGFFVRIVKVVRAVG